MTSKSSHLINKPKIRKALNFQVDKVRNRLFDISLAISSSIYNETISYYEANKYLQEVRKYKRVHLWENQITEMSEKLITQLKIILSRNYLLSHKYCTRSRNPEIQNDTSGEDTEYETIDDMIDYFQQKKEHGKVSNGLCNKDYGHKKTHVKNKIKITKKSRKKGIKTTSRKQKNATNKLKDKSVTTKINNNENTFIDLPHTPVFDCSYNVFDPNTENNNNKNNKFTIKKCIHQPVTNLYKRHKNVQTICGGTQSECIKALKEVDSNNGTVLALDLSQKTIGMNTTDMLLDKEYNNMMYENKTENHQLVRNKKLDVYGYSFNCKDVETTLSVGISPIFNKMNMNSDKGKENKNIQPLDLSQKVQKSGNKYALKGHSQQITVHPIQDDAYNNGNEIIPLVTKMNINLDEVSHNVKQFHDHICFRKQITKVQGDNCVQSERSLKSIRNSTINKTIKKAVLPKICDKKRRRSKKNEIIDTGDKISGNNAVFNGVFSSINSIEHVQEVDEEYFVDMELPEEFWNNFDLPPNWDGHDFIL